MWLWIRGYNEIREERNHDKWGIVYERKAQWRRLGPKLKEGNLYRYIRFRKCYRHRSKHNIGEKP